MEAFARIIKGFTNQWYVNVFHLQLHQNRLKTFLCTWMENWHTHFKTLNMKLCNCQSSSVIILRRNRLSFATQISVKDKRRIFHTHLLYTNVITLNIEITFYF